MKPRPTILLLALLLPLAVNGGSSAQNDTSNPDFTVTRLHYHGGGDWYNDPSTIPNLLREIGQRTNIAVQRHQAVVEIMDPELFAYPFLFMTGHGEIKFTDEEVRRLRLHLTHGGFLYADDDYGMDKAFRREMKKVFPDKELVELPSDHPIYHIDYDFPRGLPKIHEHDGKSPQGFGIFHEGRLVVYYTYETNISDGWADPDVHHDPPEKREEAFRMGINIVTYALLH